MSNTQRQRIVICIACQEERPFAAKGMCRRCYARQYVGCKPRRPRVRTCCGCGEERRIAAKERCKTCYSRLQYARSRGHAPNDANRYARLPILDPSKTKNLRKRHPRRPDEALAADAVSVSDTPAVSVPPTVTEPQWVESTQTAGGRSQLLVTLSTWIRSAWDGWHLLRRNRCS